MGRPLMYLDMSVGATVYGTPLEHPRVALAISRALRAGRANDHRHALLHSEQRMRQVDLEMRSLARQIERGRRKATAGG